MTRSVAGLFPDRASAERAIVDLKLAGFDPSRMGVVMKDTREIEDLAAEHGTRAAEGAVGGALIGGAAGAILAATGALVVPGIGPFISGGILATGLVGGAAGWLVGGLTGLGIPREEAEYYQDRVQAGAVLVTVETQGRDEEAQRIMTRDGAQEVQRAGSAGSGAVESGSAGSQDAGKGGTAGARAVQGSAGTAPPAPMAWEPEVEAAPRVERAASVAAGLSAVEQSAVMAGEEIRLPLVEERLVPGKRQREEHVHLHKDVIEVQETIAVPVQREIVFVERVPVSPTLDAAQLPDAFVEWDLDITVGGEEVIHDKRARVVEEVQMHKDRVTELAQVSATVRKERVVVDSEGLLARQSSIAEQGERRGQL